MKKIKVLRITGAISLRLESRARARSSIPWDGTDLEEKHGGEGVALAVPEPVRRQQVASVGGGVGPALQLDGRLEGGVEELAARQAEVVHQRALPPQADLARVQV